MWLLPYQRVSLRTQLPAELVLQRLAADIEPARWPRFQAQKRYEGELSAGAFKIRRIIGYSNHTRPLLVGRVRADAAGTSLEATLRLPHLIAAGIASWFGIAGFIGAQMLLREPSQGWPAWSSSVPTGMFVGGYLFVQVGFLVEAKVATRFLKEVTREGGA